MSRIATLLLVLLVWWSAGRTYASETQPAATFDSANVLYEQGKYAQAAAAYKELLKTGPPSAALYFNLGNALFKAGELGRAIAAYREAQRLAPRDPDVQANLQFAREQSLGPRSSVTWWERILCKLTVNEWTMVFSVGLWTVFLLLALLQWKPSLTRSLRGVLVTVGSLTAVLGICLVAAWRQARTEETAVVVAPSAEVRHGPLEESQSAFTAHDGAELQVLDRKGEWLRVESGSRRAGWIKREQVVVL